MTLALRSQRRLDVSVLDVAQSILMHFLATNAAHLKWTDARFRLAVGTPPVDAGHVNDLLWPRAAPPALTTLRDATPQWRSDQEGASFCVTGRPPATDDVASITTSSGPTPASSAVTATETKLRPFELRMPLGMTN